MTGQDRGTHAWPREGRIPKRWWAGIAAPAVGGLLLVLLLSRSNGSGPAAKPQAIDLSQVALDCPSEARVVAHPDYLLPGPGVATTVDPQTPAELLDAIVHNAQSQRQGITAGRFDRITADAALAVLSDANGRRLEAIGFEHASTGWRVRGLLACGQGG